MAFSNCCHKYGVSQMFIILFQQHSYYYNYLIYMDLLMKLASKVLIMTFKLSLYEYFQGPFIKSIPIFTGASE